MNIDLATILLTETAIRQTHQAIEQWVAEHPVPREVGIEYGHIRGPYLDILVVVEGEVVRLTTLGPKDWCQIDESPHVLWGDS